MEDLAIKNGLVVTPCGLIAGGLTARNGKITRVGGDDSLPKARVEVDAEGNYVLPGIVDTHAHIGTYFRPGCEFVTQLRADSEAAAIGGVTTLITTTTHPFKADPTVPRLDIQKKDKKEGTHNSFVDFKFTQWIYSAKHPDEIEALFEEGCTSFKFIITYSKEVGEPLDWSFVYRGFRNVVKLGAPAIATLHAEQPDIIALLQRELMNQGRTDLMAWTDSRPAICEAIDVLTAGLIGLELGCPVYIVHISAWQTIEAIKFLRQMGAKVYAETTPAYLSLTKHEPLGAAGKVNPPLRDEAHIAKLWQAVADGTIDTIGSDHTPRKLHPDKLDPGLWKAMPGLPGMAVTLPIMVSEGVNKGRITMEQFVKLTSENPARVFGIYPKKGVLSPGSDADIVIVEQHKEWTLGVDTLKGWSDFSPYEGRVVRGKAIKTFVRGRLVAEDGRLVTDSPLGEYVEPCLGQIKSAAWKRVCTGVLPSFGT